MTQLFDTATYDESEMGENSPTGHGRHLRSIPAGASHDLVERITQWRLDDQNIEIGRKGIQAARQALRDASRRSVESDTPKRRAA